MNPLKKLFWRFKFLVFESWNKDKNVVFLTFSSAKRRGVSGQRRGLTLMKFLEKKGIVELSKYSSCFKYNRFVFFYGRQENLNYIVADLISIWSSYNSFFKRNFLENSVYKGVFEGPYESGEVRLQAGDFVIDAGANIGLFSILACQRVGPSGKIFSFEPIKETQKILRENVSFNKIENIKVIPKALGNGDKILKFVKLGDLGKSSGFAKGDFPEEDVKVTSLDEFIKKNKIEKVDFIKADIEGMERYLLKGAEMTIKMFKPKMSICIYHRPDDPQILQNMITKFVPDYKFIKTSYKLYAYVLSV
jgi:FkbM family methyltransferase